MEFIISDPDRMEVGTLDERQYIDMDCGGGNDFEIHISAKLQKSMGIEEGWYIGVPGTEYGGLIDRIKNSSGTNKVVLSGPTWRGMLQKKIIEPDAGQDYKVVSGDANTIINNVSCVVFDGIFVCSDTSGVVLDNYRFDRYIDHLSGLEKMLRTKNARLNIAYDSGEQNGSCFVRMEAVPIKDYSDQIEYSQDGALSFLTFEFDRYKGGINHLICLGNGQLKDRLVIHLYVQKDGSIGDTKYYTGKDERVSTLNYPNAESAEELQTKGIERLKELMSYTNMDIDLRNTSLTGLRDAPEDIDIGDIVGGRDFDTGIYLSKQITQKIVKIKDGRESIEYSVGKNTLNRSTATAPVEPEDSYQKQIDALKKFTEDFTTNLLSKIYPVGSIYMSVKNVSPQSFLGGTWVAWGSGRVPVSVSTDANFNVVEKTGGSSTHNHSTGNCTLTISQIPLHQHSIPALSGTAGSAGGHTHNLRTEYGNPGNASYPPADKATQLAGDNAGTKSWVSNMVNSTGAHTHSVTTNANNTGYSGSGGAHNHGNTGSSSNLPPYITCYMWKRTA